MPELAVGSSNVSAYVTALLRRARTQHAAATEALRDLTASQIAAGVRALHEHPPGVTVTARAFRRALEAVPPARRPASKVEWDALHSLTDEQTAALAVVAFERAQGRDAGEAVQATPLQTSIDFEDAPVPGTQATPSRDPMTPPTPSARAPLTGQPATLKGKLAQAQFLKMVAQAKREA